MRGSHERGVGVYVQLFGYVAPAVFLGSGGEEEDIIHHQETRVKTPKKRLPSQPVMMDLCILLVLLKGVNTANYKNDERRRRV